MEAGTVEQDVTRVHVHVMCLRVTHSLFTLSLVQVQWGIITSTARLTAAPARRLACNLKITPILRDLLASIVSLLKLITALCMRLKHSPSLKLRPSA